MTAEPQTETLEEIAERIVANLDWVNFKSLAPKELKDAILSALRNERERCAKIAEMKRDEYRIESDAAAKVNNDMPDFWAIRARTASTIADLIREGKVNNGK